MDSHYIMFSIFAVVAYFIVTDESVAAAFHYVSKIIGNYARIKWWWLTHNPKNPVVKYLIYRKSIKMAEEIMRQFDDEKS